MVFVKQKVFKWKIKKKKKKNWITRTLNLMELDDSGRWNIVDNTYNGNAWSRFTNIYVDSLSVYLWNLTKRSHCNIQLLYFLANTSVMNSLRLCWINQLTDCGKILLRRCPWSLSECSSDRWHRQRRRRDPTNALSQLHKRSTLPSDLCPSSL